MLSQGRQHHGPAGSLNVQTICDCLTPGTRPELLIAPAPGAAGTVGGAELLDARRADATDVRDGQ